MTIGYIAIPEFSLIIPEVYKRLVSPGLLLFFMHAEPLL